MLSVFSFYVDLTFLPHVAIVFMFLWSSFELLFLLVKHFVNYISVKGAIINKRIIIIIIIIIIKHFYRHC